MNHPFRSSLWLVLVAVALLVALGIVVSTRALRGTWSPQKDAAAGSPSLTNEVSETNAGALAPVSPSDYSLAQQIDRDIDTSDLGAVRWGVCVVSLGDGRVLYARNADKLFTPASNMKIYTTAVALDLLGAEYRWRTSVFAAAQPDANGTINGDLTLYGRGAPDLTSHVQKETPASLAQLAEGLYERGIRRIRGNVIGDESYFRAEPLGDGWQWNDIQWYFGAEPSALSIDANEMDVEILPPTSATEPPSARLNGAKDYAVLSSDMATVKPGEQLRVGIHRGLSNNEVHVWGEFPFGSKGFGARLSIHDPARLAAMLFVSALRARGISVDGEVRTRDFRIPQDQRFDPAQATELAFILSKSLGEIVTVTNKESINLNAELILRTLGKERGELAPDSDPHKNHERGDDEAGVAVIRQWLDHAGIATRALALHDGSGLSRLDLVTPEASVGLLQAISKTAVAVTFRDSLPSSGTDGTLAGRLRTYKDRIAAKTGSLTYDNSLSGFVKTADGEDLAFSIMCNDQTGHASSIRVIDEIVGHLANYSPTNPNKAQKH